MSIVVGISLGSPGAMAVIHEDANPGRMVLGKLPVARDRALTWVDGSELQSTIMGARKGGTARAYIQRPSTAAMTFEAALALGSILGVLQALHVPLEFVLNAELKSLYGLGSGKHAVRDKVLLLRPYLTHHGLDDTRAEALLLADYGRGRSAQAAA